LSFDSLFNLPEMYKLILHCQFDNENVVFSIKRVHIFLFLALIQAFFILNPVVIRKKVTEKLTRNENGQYVHDTCANGAFLY